MADPKSQGPQANRPPAQPGSQKPPKASRTKEDTGPYGAAELKKAFRPNLTRGIVIASALHIALLGGYTGYLKWQKDLEAAALKNEPIVVNYAELPPPPAVDDPPTADPAPAPPSPIDVPKVGIPEPVPDDQADPEQTLATQDELNAPTGDIGEGVGVVGGTGVDEVAAPPAPPPPLPPPPPPPPPPTSGPPPDFVAVEKQPVPIEQVQPEYPEIARRAGIEGRVIVKVWVDKNGRVKEALVQRSDNDLFDAPALAAVRRWKFEPAIQAGNPVDVWVSIPIRFRTRQ